ncbi:MAG: PAS domain-containing sensor histidine kinase [Candidatus Sericytochromatia bacterium]|nr:MAG: PAS domain-containing sensor histidine kinase [Candidatus Sericytochromatia bacterium]
MKKSYLFICLLLNLFFILAVQYFLSNKILSSVLIFLSNIVILFFIQKQILETINNISDTFFSKIEKDNDVEIPYFNDLTFETQKLCKKFSFLRENILKNYNKSQTTLTSSLEAILNSTLDGVIVINNDRDIVIANESFFRLCGYEAFEISGKDSTALVSPKNLLSRSLIRFIKYAFENTEKNKESISTGFIEINNPNNKKTLRATATPLKYSKNTLDGMVINLRDITKELESEQEKNKFITGMSHEFKTPLFSIIGYSEVILNDDELDRETIKEFCKTIYEKSLQLSELIENLLNVILVSKEEVFITLEKLKLKEILDDALLAFKHMIEAKNLSLLIDMDNKIEFITNNKENLLIIFKNLLSNCIKFSPNSSEVKIKIKKEDKNIRMFFINKSEPLSEQVKENLFNKFFRDDQGVRTTPGAGLGLFIVSRILKIHGGKINFNYDSDNKEIIFIIELPQISEFDKEHFNLLKN